jgi:hypothetical protein
MDVDNLTIVFVPVLVKAVAVDAWQVAQAVVLLLAAWFMVQVLKPPGDVVLVWQLSQAIVVAM